MYIEMCTHMCIDLFIGVCALMGECIDMYIGMCIKLCIGVCTDVCINE